MKAEYLAHFGNDDMVCDCARVSFNKRASSYTAKQNARLIRYLAKNRHVTPFFHPQIQVRITAPLFVARQWFRSVVGVARSEVSRRYVDDAPELWSPDTWRKRPADSIKQGSGEEFPPISAIRLGNIYEAALDTALNAYEKLLEAGVAPEQARTILPQSMETQWVETGSLAYFARLCALRMDSHAQAEIQHLAHEIAETIIRPLFPVSWPALMGESHE